jgi:hypothetical protein
LEEFYLRLKLNEIEPPVEKYGTILITHDKKWEFIGIT